MENLVNFFLFVAVFTWMNDLDDVPFLVAVLVWMVSSRDISRMSYKYWKTVPVNLYTVTAVYDIILHTHMNTDNRYRTLMMFSDMVRTEIESELGRQRSDYLSLKARTLGPQNSRRISQVEQPSYSSHSFGNSMVE